MSTWKISGLLILILAAALLAQQPSGIVVIQGATVITGTGRPTIRNAAIVIENGKIRDIGARADIRVPSGAQMVDARNKWIIPGLIDAHVHFSQSGDLYTRPDIIDLRKWRPYEKEFEWIKQRLPYTFERYVTSGITSVMDCGGPMWNFEMREIASRTAKAPRVAVAGPLIATYSPPTTDPNDPDVIEAMSPDHARELVRQQLDRKPDIIKIWFIVNPGDDLRMETEIVSAAIAEAKSHNLRVAVHATELDTAKAAVRAGADILVHSVTDRLIDTDFLDMVKGRDIIYMTTFMVEDGYRNVLGQNVTLSDIEQKLGDPEVIATWAELAKIPSGEIPGGIPRMPPAPRRPVEYENLMLLESAGVRVVGASDAGNIGTLHGPALHREMELMAVAGMRPSDILTSVTRTAAAALGRQTDIGTLEKGKFADLVILDADPAIDIKNTRKISRVMKGGEFVF
jgi:imidazolonepropionase-like amidohydrolase